MTLGVPGTYDDTTRFCRRCLMDENVPGVFFDSTGMCSHCKMHDKLEALYPIGAASREKLRRIAEKIKRVGRGRKYDCIVGVSGGRDTSYCLYVTKEELGLRPLAVHFDNGWDSDISKNNLRKICDQMDVDLHTIIADWEESRELTNCTIRACVPYIDLTDDVGIASALYRTAAQEGVRYILLSHSFREEGITPLKWNYVDARYVRSLIKRFCRVKLKQFKNVDIHQLLYWIFIRRIKVVNITNYYDDRGSKVESLLADRFGWDDTFQHHFDNEIFALVYHYARHKFGFDWRVVELSAKIRTGVVTREQAVQQLERLPVFETEELVNYCLKKQGISREQYQSILAEERKYFTDYPNYYTFLKLMKYPIKLLSRLNVLPGQTYEKWFEA